MLSVYQFFKKNYKIFFICVGCFLLIFQQAAFAKVKLPKLISNGMVLQRNAKLKIWGWASPGEQVTIKFHGKTYHTTTDNNKKWTVKLPPMKAGGPYTMTISGNNTVKLKNIMIGDVWVSSGQSNMEHTMHSFREIYEHEIQNAHNRNIRYFDVPQHYNFDAPQSTLPSGKWVETNPRTVGGFSAVAYFFAKRLYQLHHIPVGIINASVGGSPAESWISAKSLKGKFPKFYREALKYRDSSLVHYIKQSDQKRMQKWYQQLQKKDRGYSDPKQPWYTPDISTSNWSSMEIPGYWSVTHLGKVNGVVWFRKKISVPAGMVGKPAKIRLGRIVDADSVFINGKFVGTTSYKYPKRLYQVPSGVLKQGENTIAIRVINVRGKGGFVPDKPYRISAAGDTVNLKGAWKFRLGAAMPPLKSQTFIRWKPTGLYDAMIAPIQNYHIKGVIWYQGETNAGYPKGYQKLFETLIKSWRQQWNEGNFPFLYVQLPNFEQESFNPNAPSGWAQIREAQLKTLELPKTGMAITLGLGDWNDVHPMDKKDVSDRLALVAQKVAYGKKNIVFSGPINKSLNRKNHSLIVTFKYVGKGLTTDDGHSPRNFIIAGKDGHFVNAKARIIAPNKIKVWSAKVPDPVAVRYAWSNNPGRVNLYNSKGLPASTFRMELKY